MAGYGRVALPSLSLSHWCLCRSLQTPSPLLDQLLEILWMLFHWFPLILWMLFHWFPDSVDVFHWFPDSVIEFINFLILWTYSIVSNSAQSLGVIPLIFITPITTDGTVGTGELITEMNSDGERTVCFCSLEWAFEIAIRYDHRQVLGCWVNLTHWWWSPPPNDLLTWFGDSLSLSRSVTTLNRKGLMDFSAYLYKIKNYRISKVILERFEG